MRILFVDDEPRILDGLRRLLRPVHRDWDLHFATSGEQALALLARARVDVVVSDMRMPGMDGATLLARVKKDSPDTVRIVLSGQAEVATMLHAFGETHRFMAKPCDIALLEAIISGVSRYRGLVGSQRVQQVVNATTLLPCQPSVREALATSLMNAEATAEDIAAIVARDVAMTTIILKVANSAYFRSTAGVADISRAVTFLGVDVIRALVLDHRVLGTVEGMPIGGLDLVHLREHSLRTARLARALAAGHAGTRGQEGVAYLAGVVHDVGQLVLAGAMPDSYQRVNDLMRSTTLARHAAESRVFQASHGEVGAYLLTLWGFAGPLAEAVAYHEHPGDLTGDEFGLAGLLHVAHQLAAHPACTDSSDPALALDLRYLDRVGVLSSWPSWLATAASLARTAERSPDNGRGPEAARLRQ
ncbi:MAG: HDOD domain-containing protein [Gammaproteobacteria bacterium]